MNTARALRSGAIAGAGAALAFTFVHDVFISDIWSTLIVMLVAGAACGLCIGWSYSLVVAVPSVRSWLRYNLIFVTMLVLLGVCSVIVFEPQTTIAALIEANAPPNDLINKALPVTAAFSIGFALFLSRRYGRQWHHYVAIFVTSVVLIVFLGLNVSVIGLVFIPRGSAYLIAELFGLIFILGAVFAGVFVVLEYSSFVNGGKQ